MYSTNALEQGGQRIYIKEVRETVKTVEVAPPRDAIDQILTLELVRGPGSALGYVSSTPVHLKIDGYFQIGHPDNLGAGDLILNLIPVQPRN